MCESAETQDGILKRSFFESRQCFWPQESEPPAVAAEGQSPLPPPGSPANAGAAQMCDPSNAVYIAQAQHAMLSSGACFLFVAADDPESASAVFADGGALESPPGCPGGRVGLVFSPFVKEPMMDLLLLSAAARLVANCVSSFSAFAVRQRMFGRDDSAPAGGMDAAAAAAGTQEQPAAAPVSLREADGVAFWGVGRVAAAAAPEVDHAAVAARRPEAMLRREIAAALEAERAHSAEDGAAAPPALSEALQARVANLMRREWVAEAGFDRAAVLEALHNTSGHVGQARKLLRRQHKARLADQRRGRRERQHRQDRPSEHGGGGL